MAKPKVEYQFAPTGSFSPGGLHALVDFRRLIEITLAGQGKAAEAGAEDVGDGVADCCPRFAQNSIAVTPVAQTFCSETLGIRDGASVRANPAF